MAKKPIDGDVEFDSMDFDSELDFDLDGDGYDTKPKEGAREVAKEAGRSFLSSIKSQITDSSYKRKLAGIMMPKGYSQAFNAYEGTREAVGKIYSDNESELRPLLVKSNRLLNQRGKRFKNILPKGLKDLLQSAEDKEKEEANGVREEQSELKSNLDSLDQLFKFEISNKAEKLIEDKRSELKDDKKFEVSLEANQQIAAGVSRLVAYQDQINLAYQRKNLEIGFRSYDVQRKLLLTTQAYHKDALERLDDIKHNTGLPDFVKLKTTEAIKDRLRNRLAEAAVGKLDQFRKKFTGNLVKGASGLVGGLMGQASMLGGIGATVGDSMSKSQMAGMAVGGIIGDQAKGLVDRAGEHAASIMAPIIAKMPGVKDKGDELRIMLADPVGYMSRWAQSDTEDTGVKGWLAGTIKPLMEQHVDKTRIEGKGIDDLGEPAIFDNLFHSAVTRVMPAYLESMDRSLRSLVSGEEEEGHAYSHYSGGMVTRSTLTDQHMRIGIFEGRKDNVKEEVEKVLSKIGADSLSKESTSALGLRLVKDMRRGFSFDPSDYVAIDSWPGLDSEVADELIEFFSEKFGLDVDGKFSDGDKGYLADVMEEFADSARRMPNHMERAQALMDAGVMSRSDLRDSGFTSYDGMGGDNLNQDLWTKNLLGDGEFKPVASVNEEKSKAGWKEVLKGMPEEAKRRIEAEEAYRLELAEKQRKEGGDDNLDVGLGARKLSSKHKTSSPEAGTSSEGFGLGLEGLEGARAVFRVRDTGVYTRLDAINKIISEMELSSSKPNEPSDPNLGINLGLDGLKGARAVFRVRDTGTYSRLDEINKLISEMELSSSKPNEPSDPNLGINLGLEGLEGARAVFRVRDTGTYSRLDEINKLISGKELGDVKVSDVEEHSKLIAEPDLGLTGLKGASAVFSTRDAGVYARLDAINKLISEMDLGGSKSRDNKGPSESSLGSGGISSRTAGLDIDSRSKETSSNSGTSNQSSDIKETVGINLGLDGLKGARASFRVKDTGVYTRLDALSKQIAESGSAGNGSDKMVDFMEETIDTTKMKVASVKQFVSKKGDQAKDLAMDIKTRTDKWYKESPKVQQVVDAVEKQYGKIKDPNVRVELIERVYKTTGTPNEVFQKITKVGEWIDGKYDKTKSYITSLYSRRQEWTEAASNSITSAKVASVKVGGKASEFAGKVGGKASEFAGKIGSDVAPMVEKAKTSATEFAGKIGSDVAPMVEKAKTSATGAWEDRDRHISESKERISRANDSIMEHGVRAASGAKGMVGRGMDFVKGVMPGSGLRDTGTHMRLDATNKLLYAMLKQSGFEGSFESVVPKVKEETYGPEKGKSSIGGKAWTAAKWTLGKSMSLAGGAAKAYWNVGKAAVNLAGTAGSALFGDKTHGIRDILVIGEKEPRMRAADIRNGMYVDKETSKPITKLKDIKGPVIDVKTGNEVISQEEIDNKQLVDGKGDSLAGLLGRTGIKMAGGVAKLGAAYLMGTYGVLGAVAMKAMTITKDIVMNQLTQFDAYIPGDKEPRIRSKLMKQGYYRDEKGEPIMSLDKIKGPVFDVKGNEIISQEEIEKYKSLYTRNGSMLFTFGRGMVNATTYMAKKAAGAYIGAMKGAFKVGKAVVKGLYRGVKGFGQGILGKFGGSGGNAGDGMVSDILVEQLRIQNAIYEEISGGSLGDDDKAKEAKKADEWEKEQKRQQQWLKDNEKKTKEDSRQENKEKLEEEKKAKKEAIKKEKAEREAARKDADGDGTRDNSWKDILERRKDRKKRGPNADVIDAINAMNNNVTGAIGNIKPGGKTGGFMDKAKKWGGAALGMLGMGKVGAALKGKSLWGATKALGKWGGKNLLRLGWGVAKAGVRQVAWPLLVGTVKLAGAAIAGVVGVIGLPVILAGLAIAAGAYVGWQMWKAKKAREVPLHYLRMYQYGINPRDGDRVEPIMQLEALLSSAVKDIDTDEPNLDSSKVDFRKVYEIFGLLKPKAKPVEGEEPQEEEEEEELDEDRAKKLVAWIAYRFKRVFLAHKRALHVVAKEDNLNKVDEKIKTKGKMEKFLDLVSLGNMTEAYNKLKEMTPFKGKLTHDAKDVSKWFNTCRKLAEKLPEDDPAEAVVEEDKALEEMSEEGKKEDDDKDEKKDEKKDAKTLEGTVPVTEPVSPDELNKTTSEGEEAVAVPEAVVATVQAAPNATKKKIDKARAEHESRKARYKAGVEDGSIQEGEILTVEDGSIQEGEILTAESVEVVQAATVVAPVRNIKPLTKIALDTKTNNQPSLVSSDRYSNATDDVDISAPAEESRRISRQIEMSNMDNLNESMASSKDLLSKAVSKLSSMDGTLKDIHGEMIKLNTKEFGGGGGHSNPVPNSAAERAKLENDPSQKLSGETYKQIKEMTGSGDNKNRYKQRSNPSPRRPLAIT